MKYENLCIGVCDMGREAREASIGRIFARIPDLTPFFAFTGGICHYREGIFITGRGFQGYILG